MDKKLSFTVDLAIGAFMLTVILFVVVLIDLDVSPSDSATSTSIISTAPQEQEIDHPGQKIFKANCTPCHRMQQRLIGPPLAGVLDRRDSLWVVKMIRNSSQLIASGDPTAVELFREFNGTQMTSFNSLSVDQLRSLLEYIRLESERMTTVESTAEI